MRRPDVVPIALAIAALGCASTPSPAPATARSRAPVVLQSGSKRLVLVPLPPGPRAEYQAPDAGGPDPGNPPKFLDPRIFRTLLAVDPADEKYRVDLPADLAVPGASYWAMVMICASTEGRVTAARIVKPTGSYDLDVRMVQTMGRWRFKPFILDGRAVPVCSNYRYQVEKR